MKDETCPVGCGGDIVVISATVGDRRVSLHSCAVCDHRQWRRDGAAIPLPALLEEIAISPLRRAS